MRITDPTADLPRRELAACCLTHGGRALTIAVERGRHLLTTVYLVDRPDLDTVQLTKAGGTVYTVTAGTCSCRSWYYRQRLQGGCCKHMTACYAVKLLEPAPAPEEETWSVEQADRESESPARGKLFDT